MCGSVIFCFIICILNFMLLATNAQLNAAIPGIVVSDISSINATSTPKPISTTAKATTKPLPHVKPQIATSTSNCKKTNTIVNGKPSCQGKLIFQDLFGTFETNRWSPEIKYAGEPDYEFVMYQNFKENLFIDNYVLHIKPSLTDAKYGSEFLLRREGLDLGDDCTGILGSPECLQSHRAFKILPPVISAQITTKNHFSFLYGIVEIRARLPKGDWIYPQLYLRSLNEDYGPGYESGIIRIASMGGNSIFNKQLLGGIILGQSTLARNIGLKSIRSDKSWNNDFHIFRLVWKPDGLVLSVDGKIYGTIFPPEGGFTKDEHELGLDLDVGKRWKKGSIMAPFDKEMYLSLGVGVGGLVFTDRTDGAKPWSNDDPKAQLNFYRAQANWTKTWSDDSALLIDSVKVWAL